MDSDQNDTNYESNTYDNMDGEVEWIQCILSPIHPEEQEHRDEHEQH